MRTAVLVLLVAATVAAGDVRPPQPPAPPTSGNEAAPANGLRVSGDYGFRFVRIKYNSGYTGGRWSTRGPWAYDWPAAETHLHEAISRTTSIPLTGEPIVLTFNDEALFEHPIVYLCEPGYWMTDEEEVRNLRTYLDRGGFLIVDDFHYGQWENFYYNIKQVFPDREPELLPPDHPIWSIYYEIDPVEAPSTKGRVGRYEDEYYAIYDDDGRMMVVICFNQDIGDGWEWPDRNLGDASTISFQMAINFIMYAYSH